MQMTIQATYASVRAADEALRALLNAAQTPEETSSACELAFHELLTNLVDHAYPGQPHREIQVHIQISDQKIQMETRDEGTPAHLNMDEIAMPDPEALAEGGYGLAIIQTLMDEMKYFTKNGQNTWQLVKYR